MNKNILFKIFFLKEKHGKYYNPYNLMYSFSKYLFFIFYFFTFFWLVHLVVVKFPFNFLAAAMTRFESKVNLT